MKERTPLHAPYNRGMGSESKRLHRQREQTRSGMTVRDLMEQLSAYPDDVRVTLLNPDNGWLLPIEIRRLPASGCTRNVEFIAITTDPASDEIEGLWAMRMPDV